MACGILLITHPGIGVSLLQVATTLSRQLPLKTEAFEVPFDADLDVVCCRRLPRRCAGSTTVMACW